MSDIWIVMIIFLGSLGTGARPTILQTYSTEEECTREQRRIAHGMAIAYPGDHTYRIVCRKKKGPVS